MPEDNNFKRMSIAKLAGAAVLVLVLGLAARDALIGPDAPSSAPPSEGAPLQRFSQENQLRDVAEYINGRIGLVSPMVIRVSDYDASGLKWGLRDTVLTTSAERPVLVAESATPDSVRPRLPAPQDSLRRDWLLVVGRDPGERVISWYGIDGGRSFSRCGGRVVEKLMLGLPMTREFAGAGIFDLDGRVRGMVVSCGADFAAIPLREVTRLLADTTTAVPPEDSASTAR